MRRSAQASQSPIPILTFIDDLPNICSLAGLCSATLAIYFAVIGNFPAAMIGLLWALLFDWSDGVIARRMKGRSEAHRNFGGQLDSMIDIVSFGVCPAMVLLSYSGFSPWFIPGAVLVLAAGVLRLSYFNVYGLVDESSYWGLALDNNAIVLALLFAFETFIDHSVFSWVLYALLVVLAALNVAPIKTPKLTGRWYAGIALYTCSLTVFFSTQLAGATGS